MNKYFDLDVEFQRLFVLYGLGGSGKSQLAFKFLQESQANKRYGKSRFMTSNVNEFSASQASSTLTLPINKHLKWTLRLSHLIMLSSR